MTATLEPAWPEGVAAMPVVREPAVVLVDPVLNGAPFKDICAGTGYAVVGLYTLAPEELAEMAPAHRQGDSASIYGQDPARAAACLKAGVRDVRAIVPATEPATYMASVLAETWALPGNSASVALARRDKTEMRRLAARNGIRIPRFEAVGPAEISSAGHRLGLPVIVKPPTGAGAHGVQLITHPGQLARFDGTGHRDLFGNPVREWLVEEYVRGREFAVNTFSFGSRHVVLDIWEYRQTDTRDYDFPYRDFLQSEPDPVVESFALDVLRAYDITVGPAHIELKVDASGPALIEIGARLPGAGIPGIWARGSDFRPYHDTLAAHLGRRPAVMTRPLACRAKVGMTFIRNDGPPGTLRALDGLDRLSELPGVDAVHVRARPGDWVATSDHLGAELVKAELSAPSYAGLRRLAAQVRGTVTPRIDASPS